MNTTKSNTKFKHHNQLTPMQLACLLMVGTDLGELIGVIDKRTINSLILKDLIEVDSGHIFAKIKENYKRTFIGEMYLQGIEAVEFYDPKGKKESEVLPLGDKCCYEMAYALNRKEPFFKIAYNEQLIAAILEALYQFTGSNNWGGYLTISDYLKGKGIKASIQHIQGAMRELKRLKKVQLTPLYSESTGLYGGKGWFLVNSVFEEMKQERISRGGG